MATVATALLDDARQRPDDDTPRLILADWLEEAGTAPRGQFVRAQCQAALLPDAAADRLDLDRVALDHLLDHEPAWLGGLSDGVLGWGWARGTLWLETTFHALVENLTECPPEELAWVEGIALIGNDGADRLQPGHPLLAHLAGLDLSGSLLGPERLLALLAKFPPRQLRYLNLGFNELDDDSLDTLLKLPALAGLTQLELRHNHLSHGVIRRLRNAPCWERLRALNLRENDIGLEGVLVLAQCAPAGLASLGLGAGKIRGPQGLAALLAAPFFPRLVHLNLDHSTLGPAGMEELARYKGATRLRTLTLLGNRLDDASLAHLARAQVLGGVESLSLADNPIGAAGARMLADAHYLGRLTCLALDHTQLNGLALRTLLRAEGLPALARLDLAGAVSPVRGELDDLDRAEVRLPLTTLNLSGVQLAAWSLCGVSALFAALSLRQLDVARNQLGPASCPWLVDASGLRDLTHLRLAGNNLHGLEALTRSQVLRNLRSLDLGGVPLSDPEGLALARTTAWPARLRLVASPLGLSRSALDLLHARYGRLDEHGLAVPRWVETSPCPTDRK